MNDLELWLYVAAAVIPSLTALAVRPGPQNNRCRTIIAISASASLAAAHAITDAQSFSFQTWFEPFITALVTQLTSYKLQQGTLGSRDLNDIMGRGGVVGTEELDD